MTFPATLYSYFSTTLGVWGTFIAILVFLLFAADVTIFIRYAGISRFRLSKRQKKRTDSPAISVIIPLFSGNSYFLDFGLRRILEQKEVQKEVIVVYVGTNEDFYAEMCMLSGHYPELKTTQIVLTPRYPVSIKQAINIGIKASNYSHIVISYPSFTPCSDKWLSLMAKGFQYSDIVVGYGGIEREKGAGNIFERKFSLMGSLPWLYGAIHGRPFSVCSANFGYTKELYFSVKGFDHLNLNTGDGDLFLQSISVLSDVSPVLSPRASVSESYWAGWKSWISSQRMLYTTFRYYTPQLKARVMAESWIRIAFFILAISAVALMPATAAIAVGVLLLLHFLVIASCVNLVARRVGEQGIVSFNPLFYIAEPILRSFVVLTQSKREENAWR